jgi:TolB-like protein
VSESPTEGAAEHNRAVIASGEGWLLRTWRRLNEHKVLQWGLAYVGAALAIAHGQTLLAEAYDWPRLIGRVVVTLLILGLPLLLTLAWYHGHKHLQNFSAPEMTIISLLILIGAGLLVLLVRTPAEREHAANDADTHQTAAVTSSKAPVSKPRLAIMSFENLSPDPANAFFTDGLHEEILTALANSSKALEVISRTTMMIYRSAPKPVSEVAKELGATHVLEGSVRRDGDDVRLTLQLIDARNDEHLWAQNYDRKLVKAMTLQSEVAQEVASQLAVQLIGGSSAAPASSDPQAYDLYLKAHLSAQVLSATSPPLESWRATESLISQAIERDPAFALAYAERFDLRASMFVLNYDTSEQALSAMRADLDTAERLRPNDPAWLEHEAWWAALDHQYARALALLSSAEAAGFVSSTLLQTRADVMGRMGLFADTLPLLDRAAALDPGNAFILAYRGIVLAYVHRPVDSLHSLQLAVDRVPSYAPVGRGVMNQIRYAFTLDPRARPPFGRGLFVYPQVGDDENQLRTLARDIPEQMPMRAAGLFIAEGVGSVPARALIGGALDFIYGRRDSAVARGRDLRAFIARQTPTSHNAWFLKMLASFASMYVGDKPAAAAAAREALALTPRSLDAVHWAIARQATVPVLAWAGSQDEACDLLEQLTAAVPGALPGDFAQNTLYAVGFGDSPRFKALVARAKAQAAATKLELDKLP